MTQHVPDPGEHTRHYFGYYSSAARATRSQMAAGDGADLAAGGTDCQSDDSESQDFRRECRRSWARLIQKVCEVDPLVCPDCGGRLEVIAFIDAPQTIHRILEHLELWALPARPPPAPLVQGKIDVLTAPSSGKRPGPSENADGVFLRRRPGLCRIGGPDKSEGGGRKAGSRPGTLPAGRSRIRSRPASRPPAAPFALVRTTYPVKFGWFSGRTQDVAGSMGIGTEAGSMAP